MLKNALIKNKHTCVRKKADQWKKRKYMKHKLKLTKKKGRKQDAIYLEIERHCLLFNVTKIAGFRNLKTDWNYSKFIYSLPLFVSYI